MLHDLTETPGTSALVSLGASLAMLRVALENYELEWRRFLTTPFAAGASWDDGSRNGDDVHQYSHDEREWSCHDDAA